MLVHQPSKYIDFVRYCNKRKLFSKVYNQLREKKVCGAINQKEYFKSLNKLHIALIELELQYFDVLHMRL